jgi:hypothetical protein
MARSASIHQAQRAITVVDEVGMDAHVAVCAAVQAGKGVPQVRLFAVNAEAAGAFDGRVSHVDTHALARGAANVTHFAGGECGGRDRRLGRRANRERRRKHRIAPGQ